MVLNSFEDLSTGQYSNFIQELSDRSLWNILEEIYSNLTLTSVEVFKRVSPEWRKIISNLEASKIPRLRRMEDQKISNAWKNDESKIIIKSPSAFPSFKTFPWGMKILSDERHVVLHGLLSNHVFILNAKKFQRFVDASNLNGIRFFRVKEF